MRHQTLGFGVAAAKGGGGGAPRAAPHLALVEGLIPSPSPYIRAAHSPSSYIKAAPPPHFLIHPSILLLSSPLLS